MQPLLVARTRWLPRVASKHLAVTATPKLQAPLIQVERVDPGPVPVAALKRRMVPIVAENDVEEFIQQELDSFAPMAPRRRANLEQKPLSMQEVLEMLDPQRIAKFLHVEVPIRIAERIRWIRDIRNWQEIPELVEIEDAHVHVFRDFRSLATAS
eukprot:Skav234400  [mRNA]  locus=scaffold873:202647:206363:- [translate_table: standard]